MNGLRRSVEVESSGVMLGMSGPPGRGAEVHFPARIFTIASP
jgi:hypothetical protein